MPAYALALALLVTAPLLAPGYLLLRDAVSTPRSYLSDAALGLSDAAPRACRRTSRWRWPRMSSTAASWSRCCWWPGCGWRAGVRRGWPQRCCPTRACPASSSRPRWRSGIPTSPNACCRGTGACWSATAACRGWRRRCCGCGHRTSAPLWTEICALAFWIALAGLTPTGLMLAATVALVCAMAPGSGLARRLCAAVGLAIAVVAALPWLVAAMVSESLSSSQAEGVTAVRRTGRAGARHAGQPGQPRRHLERRSRT